MKQLYASVFFAALMGCKSMTTNIKIQAPAYTTVDRVVALEVGLDPIQVSSTLGIQPYDLLSSTEDRVTIHVYHYKVWERKDSPALFSKEEGMNSGNPILGEQALLYVKFKNNKLVALWTERGEQKTLELLIRDNTAIAASKDPKTYSKSPDNIESAPATQEEASVPGLPW